MTAATEQANITLHLYDPYGNESHGESALCTPEFSQRRKVPAWKLREKLRTSPVRQSPKKLEMMTKNVSPDVSVPPAFKTMTLRKLRVSKGDREMMIAASSTPFSPGFGVSRRKLNLSKTRTSDVAVPPSLFAMEPLTERQGPSQTAIEAIPLSPLNEGMSLRFSSKLYLKKIVKNIITMNKAHFAMADKAHAAAKRVDRSSFRRSSLSRELQNSLLQELEDQFLFEEFEVKGLRKRSQDLPPPTRSALAKAPKVGCEQQQKNVKWNKVPRVRLVSFIYPEDTRTNYFYTDDEIKSFRIEKYVEEHADEFEFVDDDTEVEDDEEINVYYDEDEEEWYYEEEEIMEDE